MPARRRGKSARSRRTPFYAVTRIDQEGPNWHAWYVRLMRRGRRFSRCFSDGKYGGRAAARAAALRYRDQIVREHPPMLRREFAQIVGRNNRSGVRGVYKLGMPRIRGGRRIWAPYWVTLWAPRPGEVKRRYFSIERYGDKEAFRLARAARRQAVAEMGAAAHIINAGQVPRGKRRR